MALEVFDARKDIRNLFITPEIRSRIMRFEVGQVSDGHTHDLGHEMFVVLDGQAEFTIAGQSGVLGPGQACVARAGEWHAIRTVGDQPMTLYLSVTPHVEPTHTLWDREGGTRLPYRYGGSVQEHPEADPGALLAEHLSAADALAEAAQAYAHNLHRIGAELTQALADSDQQRVHGAVDDMAREFQALYARVQALELVWNQLAPTVAGD